MKKLFYSFSIILLSSTAMASTDLSSSKIMPSNLTTEAGDFKTCHATVKGTINGQEVDIDVTFEADNCAIGTAKLIKEATKE